MGEKARDGEFEGALDLVEVGLVVVFVRDESGGFEFKLFLTAFFLLACNCKAIELRVAFLKGQVEAEGIRYERRRRSPTRYMRFLK